VIQYAGSPNDCGALSARLSQIGIDPNDVAGVETQTERANEGGVSSLGLGEDGSCDGYVVVRTEADAPARQRPMPPALPQSRGRGAQDGCAPMLTVTASSA
jgi:hypothetical protein